MRIAVLNAYRDMYRDTILAAIHSPSVHVCVCVCVCVCV